MNNTIHKAAPHEYPPLVYPDIPGFCIQQGFEFIPYDPLYP
jgi:hypothetical protein